MEKTYTFQQCITEVQNRLRIIHDVPEEFEISKNKIIFYVNGMKLIAFKDRNKDEDIKKTIVGGDDEDLSEWNDMFPLSLENKYKTKYTESEILAIVNHIDKYFFEKLGYEDTCLCSKIRAAKSAFLPFLVNNFTDSEKIAEAEKLIEEIVAYDLLELRDNKYEGYDINEEGQIIGFVGRNLDTDKMDRCFVFALKPTTVDLYIYKMDGDSPDYDDPDGKMHSFPIHYFTHQQIINSIRKLIKNYYGFTLCEVKLFEKEIEKKESEEE